MFADLIVEALNVMHPRFAHANGRASFVLELYHQFRRLWDKALPVKFGLGHVVLHADADLAAPPDLIFWRIGENGAADARLGVVGVTYLADPEGELDRLAACRDLGYPHAVNVVVGHAADVAGRGRDGVAVVFFDVTSRMARVISSG